MLKLVSTYTLLMHAFLTPTKPQQRPPVPHVLNTAVTAAMVLFCPVDGSSS